ncbi:hypothetical protein [Streptomyces venetus]|uniref:hypothetical protein n=1 Tax=Streptomyces venetus TaxID=1701086 RepID=UPI003C2E0D40
MSQQHPQQPTQPFPPQPPKKRGVGKIAGLGCAGIIAVFVVAAVATGGGGGDSEDTSSKDKPVTVDSKPKDDRTDKAEPADAKSQAEQFRSCVAKNGTDTEKAAAEHVTKVTGADKRNDILDSAEVFTDFTGGLMGPHQGEGKLIASAFTSCYESKNGLVTVYDKDGELLANANY